MKISEIYIIEIMEVHDLAPAPAPPSACEKLRMPNPKPTLHLLTPVSQAAAAARIVGKSDVIHAAKSGNLLLVKDHVAVDADCVHLADGGCDSLLRMRFSNCKRWSSPFFQFSLRFKISNICYQW